MNNELKYWLPFRSDHGDIWVEGPYETRDIAMASREHAKLSVTSPSRYGVPFLASTKEEAEKKADLFV
ncbi:MAG: hypothetical protein WBG50_02385 [Desulfomonilaceae bacterium]